MLKAEDLFSGGLIDERIANALRLRKLDEYLFKHDTNYAAQMTILRNALVLHVLQPNEAMEMKVQAMADAYMRDKYLSKETAEKTLWAEWEEFGKLKEEVSEILRKRERKWGELEHRLGFEEKGKKK